MEQHSGNGSVAPGAPAPSEAGGPPPNVARAYLRAFAIISVVYGTVLLVADLTSRADPHVYVALLLMVVSEVVCALVFWWHNHFAHDNRVPDYQDGPRSVLRRSIWISTAVVDGFAIGALLPGSRPARAAAGLTVMVARLLWVGYAERYTQRPAGLGSESPQAWLVRVPRRAFFAALAFTLLAATGSHAVVQRSREPRYGDVSPSPEHHVAGLEGDIDRELRLPPVFDEDPAGHKAVGAKPVPGLPGYTG